MKGISKEQNEILKLVEKYGSVDIAQVYALYEPLDRHNIDSMVNMLIAYKYIDIVDEHVLVPIGSKTINLGAISCLWAMIKVSTRKEDVVQSFNASEPAFSYMCVDNKDSYIFVNCNSNETVKIRAIQEKIEREKANKHFSTTYIFVTTDAKVQDVIKETQFKETVYVAVLTYNRQTKVPEIKLLKKNVSKSSKIA